MTRRKGCTTFFRVFPKVIHAAPGTVVHMLVAALVGIGNTGRTTNVDPNIPEDKSQDKKFTASGFSEISSYWRRSGYFTISHTIWQGLWRYQ